MKKLVIAFLLLPIVLFGQGVSVRRSEMPSILNSGTNSFSGNGSGLTNLNSTEIKVISTRQLSDGFFPIYATNYGVVGSNVTTWNFDGSSLPSQDVALSNALWAASLVSKPALILPSGVIKLTNSVEVNFPNVRIVGSGMAYKHGWGNATISNNYTIMWQSNSNKDGVHLNRTATGVTELQDFDIIGASSPTFGQSNMRTVPMYCAYGVTNTANTFAKVGLTIRDTNSLYCGGVRVKNMAISGWKIGVVNGGNDEIFETLNLGGCDLGFFNDGVALRATWDDFTDCAIKLNAYGALIDANGRYGTTLGVPDQITLNNVSFGQRAGGVGLYLGRGFGFTINQSCGIYGPSTYAILNQAATLTVNGGNDEPETYLGTNWIYGMADGGNVGGLIANNWYIKDGFSAGVNYLSQSQSNLSFFYAKSSAGRVYSVDLKSVRFQNNLSQNLPLWYYGKTSLDHGFSSTPGVWQEGYVFQAAVATTHGLGQGFGSSLVQPTVGSLSGWPVTRQYELPGAAGRPLQIKSSTGDYFAAWYSDSSLTNYYGYRFLTADPIPYSTFWSNSAGQYKVYPQEYSMDGLNVSTNYDPSTWNPTNQIKLRGSNNVLFIIVPGATNHIP
jgi:hypothetical protein